MKNDLPELAPQALPSLDALTSLLRDQRAAYLRAPYPEWDTRAQHPRALRTMLIEHADALADAISADFGHRAKQEVLLSEIWMAKEEIDDALKHGKRWMKPMAKRMNKWLRPARAKVVPQPLGVVGIVVPWNYPVLLAAGPLICALAAGNRAIVKMSELTPRTSALFEQLIAKTFSRDHVAVVNGDAELGAAFSALPFDHLLFTGSTHVGRHVMRAAADNLTPVTLELGGKSPAIIGPNARFDAAVDAIIGGKTLNAGQTCIAPTTCCCRAGWKARSSSARGASRSCIRTCRTTATTRRSCRRATTRGCSSSRATRRRPARNCTRCRMRHPIRVAPLRAVRAHARAGRVAGDAGGNLRAAAAARAVRTARRGDRLRERAAAPLALYLFDEDRGTIDRVLRETISGGVTVNETLMHIACGSLPFGGVGASGMGAYHGYDGFVTFSKMKPVLTQSRLNTRGLIAPPYGKRFAAVIRMMLKF
jgi:coniferyl-aldehyde dehydrogenase